MIGDCLAKGLRHSLVLPALHDDVKVRRSGQPCGLLAATPASLCKRAIGISKEGSPFGSLSCHASKPKSDSKVTCGGRPKALGSLFGRTDFSRIFIFGLPDFSTDFVVRLFSPHFEGKSAQENAEGESSAKSSKTYATRTPDNFLQRGRAKR